MSKNNSSSTYQRTSDTDCWETPQKFFDQLNTIFGYELDSCALPENTKCSRYYTEADDGLKQSWQLPNGSVWCNPPYKQNKHWLEKASAESKTGQIITVLIPCRTDSAYFHTHATSASHMLLVKGRLKFNERTAKHTAPFPVLLLIYNGDAIPRLAELSKFGILLRMSSYGDETDEAS